MPIPSFSPKNARNRRAPPAAKKVPAYQSGKFKTPVNVAAEERSDGAGQGDGKKAPKKSPAEERYDGTEPGDDKGGTLTLGLDHSGHDPLAFDPGSEYDNAHKGVPSLSMEDEWRQDRQVPFDPEAGRPKVEVIDTSLSRTELGASMATANCDVGDSFVT